MSTETRLQPVAPIRVWDLPTRTFHWLLAISFGVAYLTSEGERWRLVHVTFGYTFGALWVFRLVWGFLGTRYSRFTNFVRSPAAVLHYLQSLRRGAPAHFIGHNPAGALAIVAMIALGLLLAATGWASYNDVGGEWVTQLHDLSANGMLLLIGLHLAGVFSASVMHRENLVLAMLTGKKLGALRDGIRDNRWPVAVALIAAVLGFWIYAWQTAPT
jgi:cytochrome b